MVTHKSWCFHSDKSRDTHCPMLNFVIPLSLLRPFLREYVRAQSEWSPLVGSLFGVEKYVGGACIYAGGGLVFIWEGTSIYVGGG